MSGPDRDLTPLAPLGLGRPALRPGAHAAPGLRRPAAAVQRRLPGGREHPGLARPRQGRRARGSLAPADRRQPVPRDPRPGLLPPVRERLQPRRARRAVSIHGGRALPRRPRHRARLGVRPVPRHRTGSGCSSSAPARAACPRRTTSPASGTTSPSATAGRAGRDDALRHPRLPAAARRPRRRGRSGSPPWASPSSRTTASPTSRPSASTAASTRSSSRSAPTCPSGSTSPTRTPAASSTP